MAGDLNSCDREPIHILGRIQSHGALLACDEGGRVVQASTNARALLGVGADEPLDHGLASLLGPDWVAILGRAEPGRPIPIAARGGDSLFVHLHRNRQGLAVLEVETPASAAVVPGLAIQLAQRLADDMEAAHDLRSLVQLAASGIREITGFDRVMIYRFDRDSHGSVVAEARRDNDVPSYLEMHFPATDIPAQARALYVRNRLRGIADVDGQSVRLEPELVPDLDEPLDLSDALLRAVSEVHVEYLRNMGVSASMSVSIVVGGKLWGLIACHHYAPLRLGQEARAACHLFGQQLSSRVQVLEELAQTTAIRRAHELSQAAVRLVAEVVGVDVGSALREKLEGLRELFPAGGVGLVWNGQVHVSGTTPSADELRTLAAWLTLERPDDVLATDRLAELCEPARRYADVASGLLAVPIGEGREGNFLLWVRPESLRTISWAGDPTKPAAVENETEARLSPRKSFEAWAQQVSGRAEPWADTDHFAASLFRLSLRNVVFRIARMREEVSLRRAAEASLTAQTSELKHINTRLETSNQELMRFAYVASHDLQTPLRAVSGFAGLLEDEYGAGKALDEDARMYIRRIVQGTAEMSALIRSLLAYARVDSRAEAFRSVDLASVLESALDPLTATIQRLGAKVKIAALPTVWGDETQLVQLLSNLIENGLKYHRQDVRPEIRISSEKDSGEYLVHVEDNGIGIAEEHFDTIFLTFKRLHTQEAYPGTGIGLAVCRRIVHRHGGRIGVTSEIGRGSRFTFTLPDAAPVHEEAANGAG